MKAIARLIAALIIGVAVVSGSAAPTIDELVRTRLATLGLTPAPVATDSVFLRRVYLDVIGTLPKVEEARAFLSDRNPDKRCALIDRLLEREEFADYWSMKWGDLLRVKSEFPINLWPNAVQAYSKWIHDQVRDNAPLDQFARTLLTSSGSNFRVPPVNFYRAVQSREPASIAAAASLTFMGTRFDRLPADLRTQLTSYFAEIGYKPTGEWKEEIVYWKGKSTSGVDLDPRVKFANWLLALDNPYFAKSLANRAWSWLMGRGIVHEPDDMRPDNPPSNPALLARLERELLDSHFDLKHLFRVLLNSQTYQAASVATIDRPEADINFARYVPRPLDAEVLIDAINQVTGTTESYSSAIPEPFTFTPPGQRAIALGDGSITSSFLETFGRPPRDTGLESERNLKLSAAERLHLLNSSHIELKIERSQALIALAQGRTDMRQVAAAIYLAVLSRYPTDEELAAVTAYAQSTGAARRAAVIDLTWALINSEEFLYRH